MYSIGITGSFGTGKTTVARMFQSLGAKVLDADKIAHGLIQKDGRCYKRVIKAFGEKVLTRGRIDRKKLAGIVFSSPSQKKKLEKIIHPEVIREIKGKLAQYRRAKRIKVVVIDVPLLFESGLHRNMDLTVVVRAKADQQVTRNQKERGMTKADILRRVKGQWSLKQKMKKADFVINNQGSRTKTRRQVKDLWASLIRTNHF